MYVLDEAMAPVPVGRKVVVIGGGMTAVDAAVQSRLLGAEDVTIVYRRGPEAMSASGYEQEWAQTNGVKIKHWAAPKSVVADGGCVKGMRFARTRLEGGRLVETDEHFTLEADVVLKAIGQTFVAEPVAVATGGDCAHSAGDGRRRARHRRRRPDLAPQGLGRWRLPRGRARPDGRGRSNTASLRPSRSTAACAPDRHLPGSRSTRLNIASESTTMADLSSNFLGIRSPNPFWLASAPPTDKEYNVNRAFEAGWGGVVWKTLGEDPPIVNVNGPRYEALHSDARRVIGFNNIELITDRPLPVNLAEIKRVKRNWPDRAVVVSLMVPCDEASWKNILPMVEDTGCDGVELNFGCPHGMSERGMGSAVGQVPEYIEMVARWCKQFTQLPVIVKLTPNITDIRGPARAAKAGGADAVSLINTVNSIISVNLDTMVMNPSTDGRGSHGGYCGPAVKPIALNMVAEIARDTATVWAADFGHRWHHHLARRGRVHRFRRQQCAGVHRGDGLWLQDSA